MPTYLVTVEVRLRVPAVDEEDARLNASIAVLDGASADRLQVEWLGQDVVACTEDS